MSRFGQRTRVSTAISGWMPSGDEVPQNPSSIEMLLVGGGGGGGTGNNIFYPSNPSQSGGGGGAGGVYSSVASNPGGGPGGTVASATSIASGVTYTITIGGSGTPSTFAAPTISTITANGGGGGAYGGGPGGSAGAYTGNPSTYSAGGTGPAAPEASQGGGGAGAGGNGVNGGQYPTNYGQGGAAITNTIRAASPTFPQSYGGGGGGGEVPGRIPGNVSGGGTYGRGGNGVVSTSPAAGQPGVCVFRYPDTFPTAPTTTGSPTLTTTGGYHIYTFTASGTIAW